jgi:hypothetical protein
VGSNEDWFCRHVVRCRNDVAIAGVRQVQRDQATTSASQKQRKSNEIDNRVGTMLSEGIKWSKSRYARGSLEFAGPQPKSTNTYVLRMERKAGGLVTTKVPGVQSK